MDGCLIKMIKKQCTKCRIEKVIEEFSFDKKSPDGRNYDCRECNGKRSRLWQINNKEKVNKTKHCWIVNNKEKVKKINLRWREKNPEKYREVKQQTYKKMCDMPGGKLNHRIRTAIGRSLFGNKKRYHWEDLVDYMVADLKSHLEKRFLPGMTWGNYGLWHIDHKVPISVFNFEKPEHLDFRKCWALKNLNPLWAKDNLSKHNKLDKPFQPSLKL